MNNTDAEGRLTLADALWYAQEHAKVYSVIDIATLTGALSATRAVCCPYQCVAVNACSPCTVPARRNQMHIERWQCELFAGAMMVSLGQGIAGAFTPSDEMAAKIAMASSETGADGSLVLLQSPIIGHHTEGDIRGSRRCQHAYLTMRCLCVQERRHGASPLRTATGRL